MKKISIITINYNTSNSILRTIDSIKSQSYKNKEWIVVDGDSNDASKEILEKNKSLFDVFISEKDRGISHAMNKGLSSCTGEIVIYMNAGDTFFNQTSLSEAMSLWDLEKYDWVTGSTTVHTEDGVKLYDRVHCGTDWESLLLHGCRIAHASTLVKTEILRRLNGFSEKYKSSMDYDLWLRLIKNGHFPQIINPTISIFYTGGTSSNLLRRYNEDKKTRIENGFSSPTRERSLCMIAYIKTTAGFLKRFRSFYKIKEFLKV